MINDERGFPILEESDLASPVALRELAETVDRLLMEQESEIDYLERPEVIIVKMSSPETVFATTPTPWPGEFLPFDTEVYVSRPGGYAGFGIETGTGINRWRSGIYCTGATVDASITGSVNTAWLNLFLEDSRGPRLLSGYTETHRVAESSTTRGAVSLNSSKLVEVHEPGIARVNALMNMTGTGNLTVQTTSTMWMYRVRGLNNV